ncbi:MAG: abhydrolase [Candidatus Tokpelaia sp. JSC161]|nr:MAG: abhydrolase [Candidatus Tokpelaia sp. JSC161]
MNQKIQAQFIEIDETKIAVLERKGKKQPGLFWLGGYRSNMMGTKASAIDILADELSLSAIRYDYSGHGLSEGDFFQGSISVWLQQSLIVFKKFTNGPQILIGSSMGGWIAIRMAQELKKQQTNIAGIILVAPAPDFTKTLLKHNLTQTEKLSLKTKGFVEISSIPYTHLLISDGDKNLVMNGLINIECPIHILHGMKDEVIPYQHTLQLMKHLPLNDVTLTLIKDGNHSLSRHQDIKILKKSILNLMTLKG